MEWLGHLFEKYPEMAVYLAIGLGYLMGGLKIRGAGIGSVTGSLLAAVLGYSGTIAFGHILLTTCGTLIIALLS